MKRFLLSNLLMFFLGVTVSFAQYGQGILIANEGNYGNPNASVSYYDLATHQISNSIYNAVNDEALGDVLQHIGLYQDKAYLVMNNSDKVVIVNRVSFQKIATITDGISKPRHIAFADNKYFVTNSASKIITVYDATTNNKVADIASTDGKSIDNIVSIGNKIFVMQAIFGTGNSIMVIDAVNLTTLGTISVNDDLQWIHATNDKLYAWCTSGSSHTDFYEIDPSTHNIIRTLSTDAYKASWKMTISNDVLYFVANTNEIYAMPLSATALPDNSVLTVTDNGWSTCYGFGVLMGVLLEADAQDFTAPSLMSAYMTSNWGQMVSNVELGMGTNGFYLNTYEGLEDDIMATRLQVYPNPAKDVIAITGVQQATVKIHNIKGQVCKEVSYTEGEQIEISDLTPGVYMVVCQSQSGTFMEKLVIN